MTGEEIRELKIRQALGEAIQQAYGWIPTPALAVIAGRVVADVRAYQAWYGDWLRSDAAKAGFPPAVVEEALGELGLARRDVAS